VSIKVTNICQHTARAGQQCSELEGGRRFGRIAHHDYFCVTSAIIHVNHVPYLELIEALLDLVLVRLKLDAHPQLDRIIRFQKFNF
jgi:hypothetical protein